MSINSGVSRLDEAPGASLCEPLLSQACTELHEKPEWRERDVDAVRSLVRDVPGLNADLSDASLIRFLRLCKFEYEQALEHVVEYYAVRTRHTALFAHLTPQEHSSLLATGMLTLLDHHDYCGARILLLDLKHWHAHIYTTDELTSAVLLVCEYLSTLPEVQVVGVSVIVDLRGLPLSALCRRQAIHKLADISKAAVLIRVKAVHLIHQSHSCNALITLMAPLLLSEKLTHRIHQHNSQSHNLHEHMDADVVAQVLQGGGRCHNSQDSLLQHEHTATRSAVPAPGSLHSLLMQQQHYFQCADNYGFAPDSNTRVLNTVPRHVQACTPLFQSYKHYCIDALN